MQSLKGELLESSVESVSVEEKLKESRKQFQTLFNLMPDPVVIVNGKGKFLAVNDKVEEMTGFSKQELLGKNFLETAIVTAKSKAILMKNLLKRMMGMNIEPYEIDVLSKDGRKLLLEVNARKIKYEGKLADLVIFREITKRKKTEQALQKSEEQARALNTYSRNLNMTENMTEIYRLTLDAMEKTLGFQHASFMILDKNMLYVEDQRGYPESLSIKLPLNGTEGGITVRAAKTRKSILIPDTEKEGAYVQGMPDIRSELAVPIRIGNRVLGVLNVESKRIDGFDEKDKKLLEILASHAATAISNLKYAKNLEKLVQERTGELKKTQEQLLRSERLAAIGEVAAMVGHDLRNPLQSIQNATYYLNYELPRLPISEKTMEMLQVIDDSLNYADKIIKDLQDFSATRKPMFRKTDVNEIVKETLSLVEAPRNIELITKLSRVPEIEADKDMIKRAFLNLAANGTQAMKEKGGTLKVSTKKSKGFVEVSFKDTGIGISKQNIEEIFSPLFTTNARGMGMGLPICKKFVESHGGSIRVESQQGKGSTFTVKLPIRQQNGGEKI